jgi:prepilin peptidase CpaA
VIAEIARLVLPLALATLLIGAALGDVRAYRIPNKLNLAIAGLALPWWLLLSNGDPATLWAIALPQLILVAVLFVVMLLMMHFNLFGGGDAKMLMALGFWFPLDAYLSLLVIMAIAGGLLSAGILLRTRLAATSGAADARKPRVPYGVAIACGGLVQTSQLIVNALVG